MISIYTAIAPVILMYPNDTPVTTHSTVSLACTVFGAPLPSVVWSWNRRNNESINNSVPITIEDTSVIRIGALYLIHSVLNICGFSLYAIGDYSCSAESYAGQTVATTALSLEGLLLASNINTFVYTCDCVFLWFYPL